MDDRALRVEPLNPSDPFAPSATPPAAAFGAIPEWEAREEAFRRHAPAELRGLEQAEPTRWPEGVHARLEPWLPLATLCRDVHGVISGYYGAWLRKLGASLTDGALTAARSWLDARTSLRTLAATPWPSDLLAGLRDPGFARALLCELFAPPRLGTSLGRYAPRLGRIAREVAEGSLRAWDVGAGTGEGTWELAARLVGQRAHMEVVGSERCPVQRLLAETRLRPHAPAREAQLAAWLSERPRLLQQVRFAQHDVRQEPLAGPWHVVTCHGVLGGDSVPVEQVGATVERLSGALAPGGLLSIHDAFREDRRAELARALEGVGPSRLGLDELEPGLWRRRA